MDIKGEALVRADPGTVWAALHDVELLKRSVPGCEEIHWLDEKNLRASLVLRIGTVKRCYEGHIRIAEAVKPERYTLLLGGTPESPNVTSRIRLEPQPEGTRICYEVEARLDKYFKGLGARAAAAVARRLAALFFKRLDTALAQRKPEYP
ncbi:MAG: CoxG family protein [Gammaproteobacteria bacterium]